MPASNPSPPRPSKCLPEKQFFLRDSILTDLFHVSHIRSVYHIFVAIMIIFFLNTTMNDFLEKGGVVHTYHFELFVWVFGGVRDVLFAWFLMQITTLLVPYTGFSAWLILREQVMHYDQQTSIPQKQVEPEESDCNNHKPTSSVAMPAQTSGEQGLSDKRTGSLLNRLLKQDLLKTRCVNYFALLCYIVYQVATTSTPN
ncbi:unnamed protein product [Protopolystoma xenopodis]|uniref:Uncharacterized protein n=1 Tax=Protopolystoma xenopodis TaxID=117903 RepID=A0A448X4G7_9PLAT|nr:unnamed protein product [Protopolystoma xenopodis]